MPIELVVTDELLQELTKASTEYMSENYELGEFFGNLEVMVQELDYVFDTEMEMFVHFSEMYKAHTGYIALFIFESDSAYIYSSHALFSEDDYYTQLRIVSNGSGIYQVMCEVQICNTILVNQI